MWKLAALGIAALTAGAVKFTANLAALGRQATLQDYLAMRCGGEAAQAGTHDVLAQAMLHCWGCYAMVAGAALIAFAAWQSAWPEIARRKVRAEP